MQCRHSRALLAAALAATTMSTGCAVDTGELSESYSWFSRIADQSWNDNQTPYLGLGLDGSKRFVMWMESLNYARELKETISFPRTASFTYFVESGYYDRCTSDAFPTLSSSGSAYEQTHSAAIAHLNQECRNQIADWSEQPDAFIRWAISQQAINEGHELAARGVNRFATASNFESVAHYLAANWQAEEFVNETEAFLHYKRALWRDDVADFDSVMGELFYQPEPIGWSQQTGSTESWAFPVWKLDSAIDCGDPNDPAIYNARAGKDPGSEVFQAWGPLNADSEREAWLNERFASGAGAELCMQLSPTAAVKTRLCSQESDCDHHAQLHCDGAAGICLPTPDLSATQAAIANRAPATYRFVGHRFHGLADDNSGLAMLDEAGYEYDSSGGVIGSSEYAAEPYLRRPQRFRPNRSDPDKRPITEGDEDVDLTLFNMTYLSGTTLPHSQAYTPAYTGKGAEEMVEEYQKNLLVALNGTYRVPFHVNQNFLSATAGELVDEYWTATKAFITWAEFGCDGACDDVYVTAFRNFVPSH